MSEDDTSGFRNITLIYLESQLVALRQLKEKLDAAPGDPELRRQWVTAIREFTERVVRMAARWTEHYSTPGPGDSPRINALGRIDLTTATPSHEDEAGR